MAETVIDTNVLLVANRFAEQASETCIQACIERMLQCRAKEIILLDEGGLILDEYQRYLSHRGQPGAGDAFFKWVWDNQTNPNHSRRVVITSIAPDPRGFEEFPRDERLRGFDPSDRKFVAVAVVADTHPAIANASDTGWWRFRQALHENGIRVEFICPELMAE